MGNFSKSVLGFTSKSTDRASTTSDFIEVVSLDCEMVAVKSKWGNKSALGRVSIVDFNGKTLLDQYALPQGKIVDYHTKYSGITPKHLKNALRAEEVILKAQEILHNKIVVGHDLKNDFQVLNYQHPKHLIRDTAKYEPFRQEAMNGNPALRVLARKYLNRSIQTGSHDSVEDALASLDLYKAVRSSWESQIRRKQS